MFILTTLEKLNMPEATTKPCQVWQVIKVRNYHNVR